MTVKKSKNNNRKFSDEVMSIFYKFKACDGSEHIARPVTIDEVITLCKKHKAERVLEMGGGIGTISYAVLKYSNAFLDIYEHNEFCREELRKNLSGFEGRYNIISDYKLLPPSQEYDVFIVDGGNGKGMAGGFKMAAWFYLKYLTSVRSIFIDGSRKIQRWLICKSLKDKYLYTMTVCEGVVLDGKQLNGGTRIECRPSNSSVLRWVNFIYHELLIWEGIRCFIAYRTRKIKRFLKIIK